MQQGIPVRSYVVGLPQLSGPEACEVEFLGALSTAKLTAVFNLPAMRAIVRHHWDVFARRQYRKLVLLHALVCSCLAFVVLGITSDDTSRDIVDVFPGSRGILHQSSIAILCSTAGYVLYQEITMAAAVRWDAPSD